MRCDLDVGVRNLENHVEPKTLTHLGVFDECRGSGLISEPSLEQAKWPLDGTLKSRNGTFFLAPFLQGTSELGGVYGDSVTSGSESAQ